MKKYALLCAVLALHAGASFAKDWNEIRMASEGAYPPFNTTTADGSMAGFDIDIGNALCEEMKAKCTWVKQEWDGMIPALVSRKFDAIIASMSITEERKAKVDFTDKYYASPLALIAKKGSELRPDLELLKGKKVGVQRGTVSDNFATKYWDGKGLQIVRDAKQDEAYLEALRAFTEKHGLESVSLVEPTGMTVDDAARMAIAVSDTGAIGGSVYDDRITPQAVYPALGFMRRAQVK